MAIKAISGDIAAGLPWLAVALFAMVVSFFASARSLQVGEGVAVIAVTSVAANMSAILGGVLVFGDPMGRDALEVERDQTLGENGKTRVRFRSRP